MRQRRTRPLVVGVLAVTVVGCAQVLGLGDYGDQDPPQVVPDAGGDDAAATEDVFVPCEKRPEDCTNGIDDNCDGLVDCADPQCGAFACSPPAPAGWQGPVELYQGNAAPPACAAPFPTAAVDAFRGFQSVGDAQCACACEAPAGVTCAAPALDGYQNNMCNVACISTTLPANTCVSVEGCVAGLKGAIVGASAPAGGQCAPKLTKTLPPAAWDEQIRLCAPARVGRGGCAADSVCVGKPALPFLPKLCVSTVGDVGCPPGPYSQPLVVNRGLKDERDCTTCACGTPQGTSCEGTGNVQLFSSNNCAAGTLLVQKLDVPAVSCVSTPTIPKAMRFAPAVGGNCPPSGGTPTGTAAPTDPVTICCMP